MLVIVVGGGKTGSHLANILIADGHDVRVIDDRPALVQKLCSEIPSDCVVIGDGSSPSVLEKAGIKEAQVVAAVTGNDETNLVVTSLARFEFNVRRVIGRVNNPKNAWLFTPDMGVDVSLNQSDILAHLVAEEMSLGDMMTLLKLKRGEFSLVEDKVHPKAPTVGRSLTEITLPSESIIVAVIRNHQMMVPNGQTILQEHDELLMLSRTANLQELSDLFADPDEA